LAAAHEFSALGLAMSRRILSAAASSSVTAAATNNSFGSQQTLSKVIFKNNYCLKELKNIKLLKSRDNYEEQLKLKISRLFEKAFVKQFTSRNVLKVMNVFL